MVTNPKSPEDQENLNKRLRSLKIDRGRDVVAPARNGTPKLLLLGLSALVVLAAIGYFYFSSSPKIVSAGEVKLENNGSSQGDTVLSASGYVVAHHKIAVGAKVMGRVAWIGVEKGDRVQQGRRFILAGTLLARRDRCSSNSKIVIFARK